MLNLKYWYLSKMISFLKCPLVPTFLLLIKARECDQKNANIFSQGPIRLEVFLSYFFRMPVCILSLISINTTEGYNVKLHNFFFIFQKRKNEMK